MSPVEPSGRGHVGRAGLVSIVAIALLFGGLWLVTVTIGKRNSPDLNLGAQTFDAGSAEARAKSIAKDGPLLFSDPSGNSARPIWLQHIGDDPDEGWFAFAALLPDRDCAWEWQSEEDLFRADCDPSLTAPADGEGLTQYHVTVDGNVVVDLNHDERLEYEAERDGSTVPQDDGETGSG